jgi:hypothetical protein
MSTHTKIQIIAAPGVADPTIDEVAAAIAAIMGLMPGGITEQAVADEPATSWHDTAKLVAQGIVPGRTPTKPGWGRIERLRRAGKSGSGITGL